MQVGQASPEEMIKHVKENPHTLTMNVEDAGTDLVSYNICPKKDKDDVVYKQAYNKINLRRGLTYIEVLKDFKREKIEVARKGLRKFFDLYKEHLSEDEEAKRHEHTRAEFQKGLKGHKLGFLVHFIEKANGQNAQVSRSNGKWVICSKNRVMFLENEAELVHKDKSRFGFTISIAKRWFQYFNKMQPQLQQQLKQLLKTTTFVGQHCDSSLFQHIVKYDKPVIKFYAIVNKNSSDHCLPPQQSFQIFSHYNLDMCNIMTQKAQDATQLLGLLQQKIRQINKKAIQESGQGFVVYIQAITGQKSSQILSLWKVKTVQYRIYRKLREKLIAFLKNDRKSNKLLKQFVDDAKQLIKQYQPPNDLNDYEEVAKKAFELTVGGDNRILRYVISHFLSFLAFLKSNNCNRQNLMKLVKDMVEQEHETEEKVDVVEVMKPPNKKRIIVLVPLTIPCSGKSMIVKSLMKQRNISMLSSDSVREEIMQQLKAKNRNLSQKELFDKSTKPAKKLFYDRLNKLLTELENNEEQECIFFIDKNHPQNSLDSTIEEIRNIAGKSCKILAVIPKCKNLLEKKGKFSYPFSKQYIITCISRVLKREQHETLVGQELHRANIVLSFANMFRDFRFNNHCLSKYFNGVIQFPLSNEDNVVSQELQTSLLQILLTSKRGNFQPHRNLPQFVQQLQETYKINELPIQNVIKDVKQQIDQAFSNYDNLTIKTQ